MAIDAAAEAERERRLWSHPVVEGAKSAVMQALVAQLGQAHGVDTAAVIAAVEDAAGKAVEQYLANASITFHTTTKEN